MPAKGREKNAFKKARQDRETLLGQVERCDSSADLVKLQTKQKNLLRPLTLTAYHSIIIEGLNQKLSHAFADKPAQLAEIEKVRQVKALLKEQADEEAAAAKKLPAKSPAVGNSLVDPLFDAGKEKRLLAVRAQIDVLRLKAEYFNDEYKKTNAKRYLNAYTAALSVADKVENLTNLYASNKITLATFKFESRQLLTEKNDDVKELQKHRGWKEIVANVLAAIIGSVVYLAAAIYTGSLTLFKPDTNATKKVKALGNAIEHVEIDENEPDLVLESSGFGCHK